MSDASAPQLGNSRRPRQVAGALAVTALMLFATLWLLADRNVAYLIRVMRHGDASTDDYRWKRSALTRPTSGRPLPKTPDCDSVDQAFRRDPTAKQSLTGWLEDGGALQFVVIRDGTVKCQWSGNGGTPTTPAALNSVTKIVTSLMLARAIDAGAIHSINDPITRYVPELLKRDRRFADITLADLVDMRSGIGFSEQTRFPWVNQDPPAVYYASDLEATVINRPRVVDQRGTFTYNDYAPNLIGLALERSGFGRVSGSPIAALWAELGAEHDALWSIDDHGFPWHESGLVTSALDLAKIGQLLLDDGRSNGHQVAPHNYIERSLAAADAGAVTTFAGTPVGYGNGWWTLRRADGTADFVAMGRHGQVMLVSPSTRTVIVRLGKDGHTETNISIANRLQEIADNYPRVSP